MNWCFAVVNNRLAEIFFEKEKGEIKFLGHAYVKESEYTTKKEKKWIKEDTVRVRLVYRHREYRKVGSSKILAQTGVKKEKFEEAILGAHLKKV